MADDKRKAYTGGKFAFEFDDRQSSGFVTSIDGAHFKADPVTYQQGADFYVSKYAGRAKYDDFTVTVGAAMSPTFWKWISASLARRPERRNGALVGYDFDFRERSRRTFYNGLISEIGFPALDAASNNAATLSVKITPEVLEWKAGDGHQLSGGGALDQMTKQKMWLARNFRFQLERFKNGEALRHCKIDAFTVKQNIIDNPVGSERFARKAIGRVELPPIVVTFSEGHLAEWMDWYKQSVSDADRVGQYTTGVITYLGSRQGEELMRIELDGVSLVSLELDKYEAHSETMATAKATLNVEGMKLITDKGTIAA